MIMRLPVLRHSLACAMLALLGHVTAQVRVDKPIELTGTGADQRQVTGLEHTAAPAAALTAATETSGVHRLAATAPGEWTFILPALPGPPQTGTQLLLQVPSASPGAVQITINGSGPHPLTQGPDLAVHGTDLAEGTMLSVVFDGDGFQLLNGLAHGRRECPAGTVPVSYDVCVAQNEHPLGNTDFFTAVMTCHAEGLRLCTWSEWILGCTEAANLGIADMLGNWEWTDDMANEDGTANTVGGIVNQGCYAAGTTNATTGSRPFRCCYRR